MHMHDSEVIHYDPLRLAIRHICDDGELPCCALHIKIQMILWKVFTGHDLPLDANQGGPEFKAIERCVCTTS